MTRILRTVAAAAVLAIGVGATSVYAQQGQATTTQSEAQPHGMMGRHGSMMNGGMGMMGQMSRMMGNCNHMMQSYMTAPNSQWRQPAQLSRG